VSDLYVSVSKLRAYDDCPYRAKFEERVYESNLRQKRGEVFHNAVEQYVLRRWSPDDGKAFIRRNWPRGEDESMEAACEIADQFVDAFGWVVDTRWIDLDRYVATEQPFRLKRSLPDGRLYVLGGRVDAIRRGPAELIDWKMTEFLDRDVEQYRAEIATSVYGAYAETVVGTEGVKVSYVRPLLRDRSPVVSFWLEHEDIVAGMERVDALAACYFGDDHPRQGNRWCSSCSFAPTCPQATVAEPAAEERSVRVLTTPVVASESTANEIPVDAASVKKLARGVAALLKELRGRDYLQELLGYECVDAGVIYGAAGANTGLYFFTHCGLGETWPTADEVEVYSWEDLRAFLEFLAPRVSAGIEAEGYHHSFSNCGWHFESFDHRPAFRYVRMTTNQLLKMCGVPAVMNDIGRIVAVEQADHDVRALVKAYYGAYVTRASVTVMTTTAAHETAEESEWAFNPKDSLALLHAHGMPTDFRDDRRGMQPGTLSIQRRAAAVLAEALDPDVIPF
jgi:hypothetical protein